MKRHCNKCNETSMKTIEANNFKIVNKGRCWKPNPNCSEKWKNEIKKIESTKENEELYTTQS